MKKIFTLILVAAGLSFAASAQNRDVRYNDDDRYQGQQQNDNWNRNDRNQSNDNWDRNDRNQSRDYGNNNRRGRNNNDYERQRQAEYDRMNRDYDRRIDGYRKDRRMDRYERERQIQQAEYERQERRRSFGKGMVVGGIAAIVLGVLIAGGK
jgi:hypothetical protein